MGNPPSGYKFLGDSSGVISEKSGPTVSYIADPNLTQVVNISSAQILTLGSSPVTLLTAPGANKYYDVKKVIVEYTYGTVEYALNTQLAVICISRKTGVYDIPIISYINHAVIHL